MQQLNDRELEAMSVKDLLALQAELHEAIRAAIRRKNAEREARTGPQIATIPEPQPAPLDLARERDAWLAARQRRS
jgi:hypothetical protein